MNLLLVLAVDYIWILFAVAITMATIWAIPKICGMRETNRERGFPFIGKSSFVPDVSMDPHLKVSYLIRDIIYYQMLPSALDFLCGPSVHVDKHEKQRPQE